MELKVLLAVPYKGNSIYELRKILSQNDVDLYVFPEGFLDSNTLTEALKIIKNEQKYIITGFKDLRNNGQHKVLVIDNGKIVDEYTKCILTKGEKEKGKQHGEKITCVNTKFGKIGVLICYEIHFPEVARIMSLEDPIMLINIIGTGMYHDLQLEQWTTLAKARAIENEVYILGCSHYEEEIPLAYVYNSVGRCELMKTNECGGFVVEVDLDKSNAKVINYLEDRVPRLFNVLSE